MRYTEKQRESIIDQAKGKTVLRLSYEDGDPVSGPYWVMTFTDDSEMSFRFMAELVGR